MYIIKEKDERKINKVAELVGERSKKLQDTVKTIQILKGDKKLSIEAIDEAIGIVNGEKQWTDLIGCKSMIFSRRSKSKRVGASFISHEFPGFVKEPLDKRIITSTVFWWGDSFCVRKRKSYIDTPWGSESNRVCVSLAGEKPLERGIIVVRNR